MKKTIIKFMAMIMVTVSVGFLSRVVYAATEGENYIYDGDTGTITLTSDTTFEKAWEITENDTYILDLNGYTLTASSDDPFFSVAGTLTITDSSSDGTGKIEATGKIYVSGSLIINAGDITMTSGYGMKLDNGYVEVNGGTITSKYAVISSNNTSGSAEIIINGGTLTANEGPTIYMPTQKSLTITDGTLNGGISVRMGTITISGGTINAIDSNIDDPANYYNYSGNVFFADALFVIGGTYTYDGGNDLVLNITGGEFNVTNGQGSAIAIYNLGKVEQNLEVNISGNAVLSTNSETRSAFEVITLDDLGVTNDDYSKVTNIVVEDITGGTYSDPNIIGDYDETVYMLLDNEDGTYTVVLIEDYPEDEYVVTKQEDGSVIVTKKEVEEIPEDVTKEEETPKTLDNIVMYGVLGIGSIIGISLATYKLRKKLN